MPRKKRDPLPEATPGDPIDSDLTRSQDKPAPIADEMESNPPHPIVRDVAAASAIPPEVSEGERPAPAREWVTRPNPFGSFSAHWPDYTIQVQERERKPRQADVPGRPAEMQIKFGDGSEADKPKAFDRIKELLQSHGFRWSREDKAWGKWLKFVPKAGSAPAAEIEEAKRANDRIRAEAESLLPELVKLEEAVRGPATGRSHKPAVGHAR